MADPKYHQVAIPDHPGGSSFVRVGTFPSGGDPAPLPASYDKSRTLAGVSAARHTTSGHWSHTDGNRITTTVGNVVDVIQGSYIAYKSAAASPPGPTLTASWASWSYTQTGSTDYPVGGGAAGGDPTGMPGTPAESFQITYGQTGGATDSTTADGKASTGDAIAATWAGRVLSYTGSASKPVTYVLMQTYANKVQSNTYTTGDNITLLQADGPGNVQALNKVLGGGSYTMAYTVSGGGNLYNTMNVSGGSIINTLNVTGGTIMNNNEADAITTTNTAPAITNVNTAANTFNFTFGIIENVNVGLGLLNLNACVGIANINLGMQTNVNLPEKLQFTGLENNVKVEETKAAALDDRFAALHNRVTGVRSNLDAVRNQVTEADNHIAALRNQVNSDWNVLCQVSLQAGGVIMLGP